MAGFLFGSVAARAGAQDDSNELAPPSMESESANSSGPLQEEREGDRDHGKRKEWKERWENLTPEQRQQAEEFRRKARDMTPEQRKEALEKMPFLKELKTKRDGAKSKGFGGEDPFSFGGQGFPEGKRDAQREEMRKKWESLTPEQRQQAEEFRRKARDMTPEQRKEALEKMPFLKGLKPERRGDHPGSFEGKPFSQHSGDPEEHAKREQLYHEMKERWEKLTPEEKEQVREFRHKAPNMTPEERREAAAKLPIFKNMSPEQRAALERQMQRFDQMPPEKREKVLKNFERWQKMNPSEREEFRKRMKHRRESGQDTELASPKPKD